MYLQQEANALTCGTARAPFLFALSNGVLIAFITCAITQLRFVAFMMRHVAFMMRLVDSHTCKTCFIRLTDMLFNTDISNNQQIMHWNELISRFQKHLLGSCASDRSIMLYDTRGSAPMRKVVLKMMSNTMAWNPMEPFMFTVANEDYKYVNFLFWTQCVCLFWNLKFFSCWRCTNM